MGEDKTPLLSIVLPSYKSAQIVKEQVPKLIAYLDRLGVTYEIIVVDDGSADHNQTQKAALALNCQFLENPRNQGKGAAVRRGMLAAKGRHRIYTDVDIPYELNSINLMLHYLECKDFHLVTGDRNLEESKYYLKVTSLRRSSSYVYSSIVGRFVAGGWYDTQCGLKGFRDHVAKDLFSVGRINRFAFDVELFYIALKRNYDIKRIPVSLSSNETSTVRVVRDGAEMVKDLGAIRLNQFLGRYQPKEPTIRFISEKDEACPKHRI